MPILGIIASSFRSAAGPEGAYDSLATVTVPSGGLASITFAGIPSGYKHLQLRTFHQSTGSPESYMQFNGDTAANYKIHFLYGTGAAVASGVGGTTTAVSFGYSGGTGSIFGASIADILDYANTSKNKTTRSLGGYDANGSGLEILYSGLWLNTSAITSITLSPPSGSFAQHSSFALFGVK
jgi:hypothetical protein